MSKKNTGGPAFPVPKDYDEQGMDLRDYFATKAMQSFIAGEHSGEWDDANCARASYRMADAMLAERNK